jgi:hypothetical protein
MLCWKFEICEQNTEFIFTSKWGKIIKSSQPHKLRHMRYAFILFPSTTVSEGVKQLRKEGRSDVNTATFVHFSLQPEVK